MTTDKIGTCSSPTLYVVIDIKQNMKSGVFISFLLACITFAWGSRSLAQSPTQNAKNDNSSATNNTPLAERRRMSEHDRIRWLENFGEVPADADDVDWRLAAATSWWGKPLDPRVFWKNKVVWNDNVATMTALKHGRSYPPPPYESEKFSKRSNKDSVAGGGPEGGALPFHGNERERAFWDNFSRTHPKPPEKITEKQIEVEQRLLNLKNWNGATPKIIDQVKESIRTEAVKRMNYPEEAFSEDALFWAYVLKKRQDYAKYNGQTGPENSLAAEGLLEDFSLDVKYLKEPLSDQQMQAANAWKITYLRRLKRENTDPSYINAYIQAWKLPASAISSGNGK